jgi:hypothetical protein
MPFMAKRTNNPWDISTTKTYNNRLQMPFFGGSLMKVNVTLPNFIVSNMGQKKIQQAPNMTTVYDMDMEMQYYEGDGDVVMDEEEYYVDLLRLRNNIILPADDPMSMSMSMANEYDGPNGDGESGYYHDDNGYYHYYGSDSDGYYADVGYWYYYEGDSDDENDNKFIVMWGEHTILSKQGEQRRSYEPPVVEPAPNKTPWELNILWKGEQHIQASQSQ